MPVEQPVGDPLHQSSMSQPMTLPDFDPARLADIHLPETIHFWPIASGWWILLILLIVAIALFLFNAKYRKRSVTTVPLSIKKLAEKELHSISSEYHQNHDALKTLKQLSIFLRRYVLSFTERETVAALTEQQWLQYLEHFCSENSGAEILFADQRYAALLSEGPYRKSLQQHETLLIEDLLKEFEQMVSYGCQPPQHKHHKTAEKVHPNIPEVSHV